MSMVTYTVAVEVKGRTHGQMVQKGCFLLSSILGKDVHARDVRSCYFRPALQPTELHVSIDVEVDPSQEYQAGEV